MKKFAISLVLISTLAFAGCGQPTTNTTTTPTSTTTTSDQQTYTAKFFTVNYPSTFTAKEDSQKILTISNDKGKIMIGDFEPNASPGPQLNMTQAQIDEFPKDVAYHGREGEIASALFYITGDDATMNELKTIQSSIKLSKELTTPIIPQSSATTKTYSSTKYAISFKYPDNWKVYEDDAQLDVQPPAPAQFSNYFTLETLESEYSPSKTLADYISARSLQKAAFKIDGQDVYTEKDTGAAGSMIYFLFSHQNKTYQLFLFENWYELPEVKAMISSIKLI